MAYWLVEQMTLSLTGRPLQGLSDSFRMFSNSLLGISPREIKLSTQNPVCDINGDSHKVEPSKDLSMRGWMNEWTVMYLHSTMLFGNKKKRVHATTHGNSSKHAEKQATLMSLIYCRGTGTRRSTEWVPDWPELHIRNKTQHKQFMVPSVCCA